MKLRLSWLQLLLPGRLPWQRQLLISALHRCILTRPRANEDIRIWEKSCRCRFASAIHLLTTFRLQQAGQWSEDPRLSI